jgi:hypothetical protein
MLVRRTLGTGSLNMLAVDLDIDTWTRLTAGGLSQGILDLPQPI